MNARRAMMRKLAAVYAFVLCAGWALESVATVIVTPGDHTDGGSATCAPLSGCSNIDRHQQRYTSIQFAALSGPEFITEIAFRPDETTRGSNDPLGEPIGPISIEFSNVEIRLATLAAPLSPTFALNLGSDPKMVYSGDLSLSSANGDVPGGAAKPFDFIIPLMTHFLYDPSLGDLLLEFKNHSGVSAAFGFSTDAVSTAGLFQSVRAAGGAGSNALTGTLSTLALVTRFTSVPVPVAAVPEPGALPLVLVGLAAFGLRGLGGASRGCRRARLRERGRTDRRGLQNVTLTTIEPPAPAPIAVSPPGTCKA